MFKAKYLVRLDDISLYSKFVCLGEQLLELLNFFEQNLPLHIWYGADIDVSFFKTDFLKEYSGYFFKKLGDISIFKQIVQDIPQFLSGTFFAVKKDLQFADGLIKVSTEDDTFRSLNVEGVLIEIRTFDTAYFDLYSDDYNLMKKIADNYCTQILTIDEYREKYPKSM